MNEKINWYFWQPHLKTPETSLGILEFRDWLQEALPEKSILIGMTGVVPYLNGPPYLSFMNGCLKQEGEHGELCGHDVPTVELIAETLSSVFTSEVCEDASRIFLRTGLQVTEEPATYYDCTYFPKRKKVFFRICFE